jgi:hypothetical protein
LRSRCAAHKGVLGNEKGDEWVRLAAEEPDAHGVEHLRPGQCGDQPGAKTATPQVTGTIEALDHRDQVAGSEGEGRI